MALTSRKITTYAKNIADLPDRPNENGYTAATLKAFFDGRGDEEIKASINGIVDDIAEFVLDVKSYGAKGDGSTDDTEAFQSVIDACITNGGGIIWIPKTSSQYIIEGQLTINTSSPIIFVGVGGKPTVKLNYAGKAIVVGNGTWKTSPIQFNNITFTGNDAVTTTLIHLYNISKTVISQCSFITSAAYGIEVDSPDNKITDCLFQNCATAGIGIIPTSDVGNKLHVEDCTFSAIGTHGVYYNPVSGSLHDIWVKHCIFQGTTNGVYLNNGTNNLIIDGNYFEGLNPIVTRPDGTTYNIDVPKITGNTFNLGSESNIELNSMRNLLFEANYIVGVYEDSGGIHSTRHLKNPTLINNYFAGYGNTLLPIYETNLIWANNGTTGTHVIQLGSGDTLSYRNELQLSTDRYTFVNSTKAAEIVRKDIRKGVAYFDTTLVKPIWCSYSGVKETVLITVTAGATTGGNITIGLSGVNFTVALAEGDTIAQVVAKIAATTFTGWYLSAYDTEAGTVTLKWDIPKPRTATHTITDTDSTGVTGTITFTEGGAIPKFVDAAGTEI